MVHRGSCGGSRGCGLLILYLWLSLRLSSGVPDGVPARLLTETAFQVAPSLCAVFNKSLRCGILPDDWKLANVVPVPKRGEKSYVENYRPISLLSLISKVLERCVFYNIKHHVFNQINHCEHGFMPGKSCVMQLIEVFEQIGRKLDSGEQIDVIYLDMSKAFDKVMLSFCSDYANSGFEETS